MDPDLAHFLTSHPSAQDQRRRRWTVAAKTLAPSPVLTAADLVEIIELAAAVPRDVAWVAYHAICTVLATAIRNRQSCRVQGFGTFRVRRLTASRRLHVSFKPEGDWWGWWMPVTAYDAVTLAPIGIWDGRALLPFGHPDNPYASAAEIPLQPDWAWKIATPMAGEPPPQPYPHPVRKPSKSLDANYHVMHEIDPAERRRLRRDYYRRKQLRKGKIVKSRLDPSA